LALGLDRVDGWRMQECVPRLLRFDPRTPRASGTRARVFAPDQHVAGIRVPLERDGHTIGLTLIKLTQHEALRKNARRRTSPIDPTHAQARSLIQRGS
jgi:hypothetical protein